MPRFYFHYRQGPEHSQDEAGSDFASAEDAYLGAFEAASEMWHELIRERVDPRTCSFEIADAEGNTLFELPFAEILDVGAPAKVPARQLSLAYVAATTSAERARHSCAALSDKLSETRVTLSETKALLEAATQLIADLK